MSSVSSFNINKVNWKSVLYEEYTRTWIRQLCLIDRRLKGTPPPLFCFIFCSEWPIELVAEIWPTFRDICCRDDSKVFTPKLKLISKLICVIVSGTFFFLFNYIYDFLWIFISRSCSTVLLYFCVRNNILASRNPASARAGTKLLLLLGTPPRARGHTSLQLT
jgi:hypothetical protein